MRNVLPILAAPIVVAAALTGAKPATLFSSYDVVSLRVEAPFDELFSRAKTEPEYVVEGALIETGSGQDGKGLPVKIALRGHTSRRDSECSFPKLKIDLSEAGGHVDGSLLNGVKTLKIGTHCGEVQDDTLTRRFGRLPNERSPLREAAVYRLLDAAGVPALRARPATITYVRTGARTGESGAAAEPLVRHAMLLEDEDAAIARLGGTAEIDVAEFTSADKMFSVADAANLAFAEAMIGNFDWCLKFTADDTYRCDARNTLWNIIAMATPEGKARPLIYDFDVAGMVAGSHRWFASVYNEAFVPSKSQREVEVIGQVQRTRSLFPRAELDAARQRFAAKKAAIYRALDESGVDPDGARHMREYLDAFFREIESDDRFYRPVVVVENTKPRGAANPSAPVCTSRGAIPIGTPVSQPLDTRDNLIRVVVLDALWHWAPPAQCPAVQKETVWIEADAISRDYPKR
jgi:hypothetical protein